MSWIAALGMGAPPPPMPDFDGMRKSWRSASTSQKFVRVGLLGGLVGAFGYLFVTGRDGTPKPPGYDLPPEPVEREVPRGEARKPVSSGRGQYR